jgi:hypothetical protein
MNLRQNDTVTGFETAPSIVPDSGGSPPGATWISLSGVGLVEADRIRGGVEIALMDLPARC